MSRIQKPLLVVATTTYKPWVGGAELAVENITDRISNDFDIIVLTARIRKDLLSKEVDKGVTILRLGMGNATDKLLLPFRVFWYIRSLRKERYVITWGVMVSYASIGAWLAKLWWKVPFVLTIQEGDREWERSLSQWWWRPLISHADYITVISSFLENIVRSHGAQCPVTLIPNGVDKKFFLQKKEEENFISEHVIVSASRLVEKNGIDILLNAAAKISHDIPWRIRLFGDGPLLGGLREQARRLGIDDRVEFCGTVRYEDLPKEYEKSSIFVRPSRSEGLGTAFLEAMASGLITIGTSVGGIPDFLKDNETGLVVPPDNIDALFRALKHAIELPFEKRKSIITNGIHLVQNKYTWEQIAEDTRKIFLSLEKRKKTIVIATPLYPPDIGGPAAYAKAFEDDFQKRGYNVRLVSFGGFLSLPPIIRHIEYTIALMWKTKGADGILALDQFSVGFPAAVASFLFQVPLVLRIGGDFLWERAVERGDFQGTLVEFYESNQHQQSGFLRYIVEWVISRARLIIFNSAFQDRIYEQHYGTHVKSAVVYNAITHEYDTKNFTSVRVPENTILYAGRFIKLKNLHRLLEAFSASQLESFHLMLVGDGPEKNFLQKHVINLGLEHRVHFVKLQKGESLRPYIQQSVMCVLPSLSDVSPNFVFESIAERKAVIVTKESGFPERFPHLLYVDPESVDSIRQQMCTLADAPQRVLYEKQLVEFPERPWDDVVNEVLVCIQKAIPTL